METETAVQKNHEESPGVLYKLVTHLVLFTVLDLDSLGFLDSILKIDSNPGIQVNPSS